MLRVKEILNIVCKVLAIAALVLVIVNILTAFVSSIAITLVTIVTGAGETVLFQIENTVNIPLEGFLAYFGVYVIMYIVVLAIDLTATLIVSLVPLAIGIAALVFTDKAINAKTRSQATNAAIGMLVIGVLTDDVLFIAAPVFAFITMKKAFPEDAAPAPLSEQASV